MDEKKRQYLKEYREKYKSQIKRVNLTLNKAEHRAFSRAAQANAKKLSPYIKELALANLEQQANIPEDLAEELRTLKFAIRNIANNINQIAHYSHTIRSITSADEHNLFQYLKQLEDAVQDYTNGKILGGKDDY